MASPNDKPLAPAQARQKFEQVFEDVWRGPFDPETFDVKKARREMKKVKAVG